MFEWIKALFQRTALEPASHSKIQFLESLVGYKITEHALYLRALRHRSRLGDSRLEKVDSYERLEFLGDAVLDLAATELLFELFPKENEGALTKLRAQLVRGDALAKYAIQLKIAEQVEVGKRARSQNVHYSENVLADVFEAIIGAIFRDKGYLVARKFVHDVISKHADIEELKDNQDNYKSVLLEYTQGKRWDQPDYFVAYESGPDHDKTFEIEIRIGDKVLGVGQGKSKKKAEQLAAKEALRNLKII